MGRVTGGFTKKQQLSLDCFISLKISETGVKCNHVGHTSPPSIIQTLEPDVFCNPEILQILESLHRHI